MKDIIAFDVETTGLNPQKDFIIQLAAIKLDSQTLEPKETKKCYIKPDGDYEITQQAFEKHGITKDFLKTNGASLKAIGQKIIDFFEGCDILTFNGNNFDVNFLYSNLKNVGLDFPMKDRIFYDAFLMYKKLHPSTLEALYKYYTGEVLVDAHDAFADVKATVEIFKHLHQGPGDKYERLTRYEMDQMEENQLYSPERSILIKQNFNNTGKMIVFAVGKHKDEEFIKVCKQDPTYIKWFMENIASDYTKNVLREYYKEYKNV